MKIYLTIMFVRLVMQLHLQGKYVNFTHTYLTSLEVARILTALPGWSEFKRDYPGK